MPEAATQYIPPPPPPPPPRPPRNYSWVKPVAIYGSIGGAILIGGYAVYTYFTGPTTEGISACQQAYKTALVDYGEQYQAMIKQNGGQPLTTQQETYLNGYQTAALNAISCMKKIANYSSSKVTSVVTSTITEVLVIFGLAVALPYAIKSYAQSINAIRNKFALQAADDGEIPTAEAQGLMDQTATATEAAAEAEVSAGLSEDEAAIAAAEASNDAALVAEIESYDTTIYSEEVADVLAQSDYFAELLA